MKWLWLSCVVVVLDQITKQIADNNLQFRNPVEIIPGFFNLALIYNEGAAFSFLSQSGGWQRWFFMAVSSVISIALIIWLRQIEQNKRILATGVALILGGAIGNLIDRTIYGYVIDFIQVYYSSYYFPAFNIADSAISMGAALLILDIILDRKHSA